MNPTMIRKWLDKRWSRRPQKPARTGGLWTPAIIETVEQAAIRFAAKDGKLIAVINNGEHDVVLFWAKDGAVNEAHLKTGDGNLLAATLGLTHTLQTRPEPERVTQVTMTLSQEGQKRLTNLVAASGLELEGAVLCEALRFYEWAIKMRSEQARVGASWGTLPASVIFVDAFEARDSNELKQ